MRIFFFYLLVFSFNIFSQELNDTITLNEVKSIVKPTFDNVENKSHFNFLETKLLKVYPIFTDIYVDYYSNFKSVADTIQNKKIKNRFIKTKTDELKSKYFATLKSLTNYDGKILTKLIHRETGSTSYEIIKKYKGKIFTNLLNLQTKFANVDLNEKFSPESIREDKYINIILQNLFFQKLLKDVKSLNLKLKVKS